MKIPEQLRNSCRSVGFRSTTPLYGGYRLINVDTLENVVDVRLYWGRGEMCRCIIWLYDRRHNGCEVFHGVGLAGGHGYDKPSQAVQCAFNNMGIELEEHRCGGVGGEAVERAIISVGKQMFLHKIPKVHLIHFYS